MGHSHTPSIIETSDMRNKSSELYVTAIWGQGLCSIRQPTFD